MILEIIQIREKIQNDLEECRLTNFGQIARLGYFEIRLEWIGDLDSMPRLFFFFFWSQH